MESERRVSVFVGGVVRGVWPRGRMEHLDQVSGKWEVKGDMQGCIRRRKSTGVDGRKKGRKCRPGVKTNGQWLS